MILHEILQNSKCGTWNPIFKWTLLSSLCCSSNFNDGVVEPPPPLLRRCFAALETAHQRCRTFKTMMLLLFRLPAGEKPKFRIMMMTAQDWLWNSLAQHKDAVLPAMMRAFFPLLLLPSFFLKVWTCILRTHGTTMEIDLTRTQLNGKSNKNKWESSKQQGVKKIHLKLCKEEPSYWKVSKDNFWNFCQILKMVWMKVVHQ